MRNVEVCAPSKVFCFQVHAQQLQFHTVSARFPYILQDVDGAIYLRYYLVQQQAVGV